MTISSLNMQYLVVLFCEVGLRCIMPIESSRIIIQNGRSIWQRHEEKQHLRNEKKSLIIASTIIVTTKFNVSYGQVYSWVKKYDSDGDSGLTDRRGQRKTDDEVDELERLRRENLRLKRQLEEKDMVVELLKKVKDFERM